MPAIDGFEVPFPITGEFQRLVDRAGEAALLGLAKTMPDLKKGFRNAKTGIPFIRQRLRTLAGAPGPFESGLARFLAGQGLTQAFVAVLSREALERFLDDFCRLFGRMAFLAAMLLDEREPVRAAAIAALREEPAREDEGEAGAARRHLQAGLALFFRQLAATGLTGEEEPAREQSGVAAGGDPPPRGEAREEAAGRRIAEKEQRRLQRHAEHLEKRLAEADEQVRKLRQQVDQGRKRSEELCRERDEAQAERAGALARLEGEVAARVEAALAARFRVWFAAAEQSETLAGKKSEPGGDLLERAAAALARQQELDRRSGNLRLLRERLERVEELRAEVLRAAAEALSPLPELRRLERELAAERDRLKKTLGETEAASPLTRTLLARIGAARRSEDILHLQRLLADMEAQELLPAGEIRQLRGACHAAMGKLYDAHLAAGKPRRAPADPLLRLQEAVAQGQPFALLVDGHNVLFGLPHIYGQLFDAGGLPGSRARQALLAAVAELAGDTGRGRAWVFFDGAEADDRPYSATVREVYSGGGEAARDRADQVILDHLDRVVGKDVFAVVVTNDGDLGRAARKRGAALVDLAAFSAAVMGLTASGKTRRSSS